MEPQSDIQVDLPRGNNVTNASTLGYDPVVQPREYFSQLWVIAAVMLSSLGILANLLSVCAVARVRPHLTPHFLLILSLAFSDILIGVSVMAHLLNQALNPLYSSICAYLLIKALNNTGLNITLLNLFGMAIDHYLAILRPLHHPLLMSKSRANVMIVTLWLIAVLTGYSGFIIAIGFRKPKDEIPFCELVLESPYHEEFTVFFITLVSLFLMCFIYIRIYLQVRRRQAEMSRHTRRGVMRRNQRALITTLLILGSFAACWLPNCLFQIAMLIQLKINPAAVQTASLDLDLADRFLYNLMLINCVCDPIIYTMRMREVQHGYRRLFPSCLRRKVPAHNGSSVHSFSSLKWIGDKKVSMESSAAEVTDRLTWTGPM